MHLAVGQPIVAAAGFQPATPAARLEHDAKKPPRRRRRAGLPPTKQAKLQPHCARGNWSPNQAYGATVGDVSSADSSRNTPSTETIRRSPCGRKVPERNLP